MNTYPSVSIVFPNYNGGKQPLECLKSIQNLNYPKNKIEVIVVDNGSTDGSLQQFKVQSSKFKVRGRGLKIIENRENVGFAKAINQGIKQSNGEYIFIGNDDIVFGKDSLRMLVEHLVTHPKVGILGGKIFSKEIPTQVISCGYMINIWTGNIYPYPHCATIHEPDWIQGCAMLVRKSVLDKTGLLDHNFSLIYFEDIDLCLRIKKAGYRIVYLPTAHFWHGQSKTMDRDLPHKYYQWYKNKIRFVLKNLPYIYIVSILSIQFFFISPYRALVLQDGRFIPFLRGFLWNIKNIQKTILARTTL